ncbi:MAG: glutamyl-tRNA reductase [Candidatus Lambdaproteobacteria bacterium]|nr:glutamyl-tRNA reductase [Candidatus Lambdaproteobacteria bacterium]
MTLSVLSYSYKKAPVELRERLAVNPAQIGFHLNTAREATGFGELLLLSTCNRVEYYFTPGPRDNGHEPLLDWLRTQHTGGSEELREHAVALAGREAVTHLHRVACSLDSMVVGEPQILGQLKDAYRLASEAGTVNATFSGLMPRVFRTAKRVRSETDIARFAVSVSYVAVELAARIFESLHHKTVLVVGAGEMAELALTHLIKAGVHRLLICNRTYDNAVALAEEHHGEVLPYEQLGARLHEADIIISSTGARSYVIDAHMARGAARQRRGEPMFFIDIAVPRDVDPAVNELSNVYCYDIDDLKTVADNNLKERAREASKAHDIIVQDIEQYERWVQSLGVVPTVKALRHHFSHTAHGELDKALARMKHLDADDRAQVQRLVHAVVNKLLHTPSTQLRRLAEEQDGRLYTEALATLFDLPVHTAESQAHEDSASEGPLQEQRQNVVRLPVSGQREH